MYTGQRGQKRVSGLLELEIQMAVCHHVGAANQTQVLRKKQPVFLNAKPQILPRMSFRLLIFLKCVFITTVMYNQKHT